MPANNAPGSLSGSPFYNRPLIFLTDTYSPSRVRATALYTRSPRAHRDAVNQTKVYGNANPALTATITGGLPGDSPAGWWPARLRLSPLPGQNPAWAIIRLWRQRERSSPTSITDSNL